MMVLVVLYKYELSVVRVEDNHEEYTIGYFTNEDSLAKWANQSDGELAKENADKEA